MLVSLSRLETSDKKPRGKFLDPPWDETSEEFKRIDQKLPPEEVARRIDRWVNELDLSALEKTYRGRGHQGHRPDLLLKAAIYLIWEGVQQPARWFRESERNETVQWLLRGSRPSRTCWWRFRNRLGPVLEDLHQQVIQRALDEGVCTGQGVAIDGSAIPAASSRHRLLKKKSLLKRLDQLDQAMEADQQGKSLEKRPSWMARTVRGRVSQQARFQEALERQESLLEHNAQRPSGYRKDPDKIKISPTEPEACCGRDKLKVYCSLYNVQLARDLETPLILAGGLFSQATDTGTLGSTLDQLLKTTRKIPETVLLDPGYATIPDLQTAQRFQTTLVAPLSATPPSQPGHKDSKTYWSKDHFTWLPDLHTYSCPQGHQLHYEKTRKRPRANDVTLLEEVFRCEPSLCQACPVKASCTGTNKGRTVSRLQGQDLLDELEERMKSLPAQELYKRRKETVELGFADLKTHRGLNRFKAFGLGGARTQLALTILAYNLVHLSKILEQRYALNPKEAVA